MDENQLQKTERKVSDVMGRPGVLTEKIVQDLLGALQNGMSVTKACEYAGIARRTFYDYMAKDQDFSRKIILAQNNQLTLAGNVITRVLTNGADRDAAPIAKWMFEKKMPEVYGDKAVVNNQQNNYYFTSDEQFRQISKESGIDDSDPVELLASLEEAERLVDGEEERSPMELR